MAHSISGFDTISRHRSPLSQPPSVIKCLTKILNYIKSIMDDDRLTTLMQFIEAHMATTGISAHKLNITEISSQVIDVIYDALIAAGDYDGDRSDFLLWLAGTHDIYHDLPTDPDKLEALITQAVMDEVLYRDHDAQLDVHQASHMVERLDILFYPSSMPIFRVTPGLFPSMLYRTLGDLTYNSLVMLVNNRLISNPPTDPIIDRSQSDTAIYYPNGGIIDPGLVEYGESDPLPELWKKPMDYYSNHADYVVSSGMDQTYKDTLLNLRSNMNSSYSKVLFMYTVMKLLGWGIYINFTLWKGNNTKDLDIINLTSLNKSLAAVTLYGDTLKVSFDNFNPTYTTDIFSGYAGEKLDVKLAITGNADTYQVGVNINDEYSITRFDNVVRMFDTDPHYLFIPPLVEFIEAGTIRIRDIRIYNDYLSEKNIESTIFGFNQRA